MTRGSLILEFCAAHPEEGRRIFDQAISRTRDPARVADLELWREWACNPEFRRAMAEHVYKINEGAP